MKKTLLLVFLFAMMHASAFAQTEQGARLVGGTGTLHINTGSDDEAPTFVAVMPRLGFFVIDNFAIGAGVPLVYSSRDNSSSATIGISPFLRGYFGSSATRFLVEGRLGYIYSQYKDKDFDFEESDDYVNWGLGVGVAQFVNEHVALEFILSYDEADAEDLFLDYRNFSGINFNIGLQIHLFK